MQGVALTAMMVERGGQERWSNAYCAYGTWGVELEREGMMPYKSPKSVHEKSLAKVTQKRGLEARWQFARRKISEKLEVAMQFKERKRGMM